MTHDMMLALLLIPGCALVAQASAVMSGGVSPSRLAKLTKGINLSHWFAQAGAYTREHLDTYDTASDAALIKAMGFRHVRFTFNEATIVSEQRSAELDPNKLKRFDAALDFLLAQGLAVIVDFHPEDEYKRAVAGDPAAAKVFVAMWGALARHLAARDPERVFFEVMNEPVLWDATLWNDIQHRALAAMRASAPRHTLIASGPRWSSVDQLELITPVADRNVVYNFHCYEPFWFTHQGANWTGTEAERLKNVPYPSSPEAVAPLLTGLPDEQARQTLLRYGAERWDADKLDAVIGRAAAWGRKHDVPVTCNEFGVYRKAPPADRNRCIADIRKACEKYGIGWCMWDYAGGFAVAPGKPGARVPDPDTVTALGLSYKP